jgi:hypothetical protein
MLTEPISLACDRYVQYLLAGANPSVLNQHRWGYNHLRAPPSLRLANLNIALSESDVKHLSPTHGLSTTRRLPKSISTPSNG